MQLRQARRLCAKIKRAYFEDPSAPINVMANCEAQLSFLESWLMGQASATGKPKKPRTKEIVGRELALPNGLASPAAEDTFKENFSPMLDNEVLAQELDCSAKSLTCFLPGKLYVTTARLCWISGGVAVKASVSLPWSNVQRIRAIMPKFDKGRGAGGTIDYVAKTFGISGGASQGTLVSMTLVKPVDFDGMQLERLELVTFDPTAVMVLQRCTDNFTGQGCFEAMVSETGDGLLTKDEMVKITRSQGRQLESTNAVWELQRRTAIFTEDWQKPFLPIDMAVSFARWTVMDEAKAAYVTHPMLSAAMSSDEASAAPPIEEMFALGCDRRCQWQPVVKGSTDPEGWEYGGGFFSPHDASWANQCGPFSLTRRRLWIAEFPDLNSGPVEVPRTTLLDMQCKTTSVIFNADLGTMPLATLGGWLQADDWEAPGTYMRALLDMGESTDRKIEQWQDRDGAGLAKQVQGKLRLAKMVVPVPPNPMCPPTTRVDQTHHVLVEQDRVIREVSTMSWDVPFGTTFNVVIRDTFTAPKSGVIKFERSFGLEWVKSTMMKSMIERDVPGNLVKDAEKVAVLMQKWVSSGGPPGGAGVDLKQGAAATALQSSGNARLAATTQKKPSFCNISALCCADNRSTTDEVSLTDNFPGN